MTPSFHNLTRVASHWTPDETTPGRVTCTLCPRHCRPREGQTGFCRVRGPIDGTMRTFNYGRSVAATEEVIETEAVNHYRPGARILSLGNVGCMMSCSFCQNWETSQVRHLDARVVEHYTPEQILGICERSGIDVISWTYNDPVVWHEFVVETSRLAQTRGIRTLYKSAFYIEERPVEELLECIDIFSLSLKSMSEDFYRKTTKGRLQPVLDRIEQVHRAGRHLEVSQLVVPELNDDDADLKRTVDWIGDKLGTAVPLHFVAFHPAYRYTHVSRTPVSTLMRARELARAAGIEHCYLGNIYGEGLNDTRCAGCEAVLVRRFGLTAQLKNLTSAGDCARCGHAAPIVEPFAAATQVEVSGPGASESILTHFWEGDVQSAHVHRTRRGLPAERSEDTTAVTITPLGHGVSIHRRLGGGLERMIVSRQSDEDRGFRIAWDGDAELEILPVLDRAHFPPSAKAQPAKAQPANLTPEKSQPARSQPANLSPTTGAPDAH